MLLISAALSAPGANRLTTKPMTRQKQQPTECSSTSRDSLVAAQSTPSDAQGVTPAPPTAFRNAQGYLLAGNPYRFPIGNTGYKAGVPGRKSLRDYLIDELDSPYQGRNGRERGKNKWWAVAKAWVKKGMDGSERALAELRDTLEGRPLQRQEISGIDGMPIMIGASPLWPAQSGPFTIEEGTPTPALTAGDMDTSPQAGDT